jgi:hypothetical protein
MVSPSWVSWLGLVVGAPMSAKSNVFTTPNWLSCVRKFIFYRGISMQLFYLVHMIFEMMSMIRNQGIMNHIWMK